MSRSLNDLIVSAISGASEDLPETDLEKVAESSVPETYVDSDIEKVASALEFVGTKGIETFISIEKVAAMHGLSPEITHSVVSGENAAAQDGFGSSEEKTHHPALASNEAAQAFDPASAKNKLTEPTLKSLLNNASPDSIRKNSSFEAKGAMKAASDKKELIRQAIAAKMAQRLES